MLFASTAIAAAFCLAYITKPVILTSPAPTPREQATPQVAANIEQDSPLEKILPDNSQLPGETRNSPSVAETDGIPPVPLSAGQKYEETNLRMQHILDAESPSGDLDRIIVDVPVLYESRNLRWTQKEVGEARVLMQRLTEHQEKTRNLRDEGKILLQSWNVLMESSIPTETLRADSPSLPSNQRSLNAPIPPAADDSIKVQPNQE